MSKKPRSVCRAEKWAVHPLQGNVDLTVLPAVKGNAAVVFNTMDYTEEVLAVLEDPPHKKLAKALHTVCRMENCCPHERVLTS
jgi:hypothetical protein